MSYIRALRASAWILMLLGAMYFVSHLQMAGMLAHPADDQTRSLANAMNGYIVPDFPITRAMTSIYLGLSLMFTVTALLVGAIMVTVAKALADQPKVLRPIARMYLAGMLVMTIISVNYFIWPPTVCLLVSLGLAAFAIARLRKV